MEIISRLSCFRFKDVHTILRDKSMFLQNCRNLSSSEDLFTRLLKVELNVFHLTSLLKQKTREVKLYNYWFIKYRHTLKALFHLSQELTRKLAANIFIQSHCLKVHFNEMQTLAASLQVAFSS